MKRIIVALVVSAAAGCTAQAALSSRSSSPASSSSSKEVGFAVASTEARDLALQAKKEKRDAKRAQDALVALQTLQYEPVVAAEVISVEEIHQQIADQKVLLIRQYARKLGAEALMRGLPERLQEIQTALDAEIPVEQELAELRRPVVIARHLVEGLAALDQKREKQLQERAAVVAQQLPHVLDTYNKELQRKAYKQQVGAANANGAVVVEPAALDALELRDACFKSVYTSCKDVVSALTRTKGLTITTVTNLLAPFADLVEQNSELLLADDDRLDDAKRAKMTEKVEAIRRKVAEIINQIGSRNLKIKDVSNHAQRAEAQALLDACNKILRGLRVPEITMDILMDTKKDSKVAQGLAGQLQGDFHRERQVLLAQDEALARRLQGEDVPAVGQAGQGDDEEVARRLYAELNGVQFGNEEQYQEVAPFVMPQAAVEHAPVAVVAPQGNEDIDAATLALAQQLQDEMDAQGQ